MRCSLLFLLAACGGSSHAKPETPKAPEKPDAYWDWHKAQPKSPEEPVRATTFEPPQQCGQGPYRFTVETVGSKYAEGVQVTMCTAHEFRGSVSYVAPGERSKTEAGFGEQDRHHDKCRVDATVVATQGTSSGGGGKATGSGPRGKGDPAAAAKPVAMELHGTLVDTGMKCPKGTYETPLFNQGYTSGEQPVTPLPKGPFTIEVWSELPNDLAGSFFVVRQRGVPAGYKVEDWVAYRRAYDAWYAKHDAALAQSIADGHKWTTVEPKQPTKQPPPARAEVQPPRPSVHAAWIPGYWQDSGGWEWSAGFWRVPNEDIEQEKTVEAPAPPPAPKVEAPPVEQHRAGSGPRAIGCGTAACTSGSRARGGSRRPRAWSG